MPFVANELPDGRLKTRVSGILSELDVEKAFDKLNWCYLFTMLSSMGFGDRWI